MIKKEDEENDEEEEERAEDGPPEAGGQEYKQETVPGHPASSLLSLFGVLLARLLRPLPPSPWPLLPLASTYSSSC